MEKEEEGTKKERRMGREKNVKGKGEEEGQGGDEKSKTGEG